MPQTSPKEAAELRTETSHLLKGMPQDPTSPVQRPGNSKGYGRIRPESFLQWTRGWLWWYWINKTRFTKPRTYLQIRTPTDSSQEIPPPNIKTNYFTYSGLLKHEVN